MRRRREDRDLSGWCEAFEEADRRIRELAPEIGLAVANEDAAGMIRGAKAAAAALDAAVPAVRRAAAAGDPAAALALVAIVNSRDGFLSTVEELEQ